jgi:hypothetical protein
MNMSALRQIAFVMLLVAVAFLQPAWAEQVFKHSGMILAIDEKGGKMILAEVGPWRVEQGATKITRLNIVLTPSTSFALVRRSAEAAFPGDYVETGIAAENLKIGDFVTVDCLHKGGRLIAQKITVPQLDMP